LSILGRFGQQRLGLGRDGGLLAGREVAPVQVDRQDVGDGVAALAGHSDGLVTDDPTIGCCWDADRLDLWRVGAPPVPALLSTEAAKAPEFLAAGRGTPVRLLWPTIRARCAS
jgi:hypothetical protein